MKLLTSQLTHFSFLSIGYTPLLFHPRTLPGGVTPVETSSLCSNKTCAETAINGAEKGCRDQSSRQRKLFWTNYPHSTVSRLLSLSWAVPKYTFPNHTCRQLWTTLADSCVIDSHSTKWRLAKMWRSKQGFCLSFTFFLHHLFWWISSCIYPTFTDSVLLSLIRSQKDISLYICLKYLYF